MDLEHNGVITYNDLKQLLIEMGKDSQQIQDIFNEMQYDQSDEIEFSDFISSFFMIVATLDRKKYINEQFLTEAF